MSNILAKLDARTRAELTAIAHRDGLVPAPVAQIPPPRVTPGGAGAGAANTPAEVLAPRRCASDPVEHDQRLRVRNGPRGRDGRLVRRRKDSSRARSAPRTPRSAGSTGRAARRSAAPTSRSTSSCRGRPEGYEDQQLCDELRRPSPPSDGPTGPVSRRRPTAAPAPPRRRAPSSPGRPSNRTSSPST